MQAAPARYVSVSELYSTDEVELLLDEIRELEPTSCRGEDVQDFEIAGSGCGAAGGRSPAGTELTERSWDSHAQYLRDPPRPPQALAPVYCRPRYLLTLQGLCTLLIAACSASVCGCVWGAVGARQLGAARALQLGALTSLLLHGALLAMRLSALHLLMPLDWHALSALCCVWTAGWELGGAGTLLHAVLLQHAHAPQHTKDLFFAAIGLACVSSTAALTVLSVWARARLRAARAGGAGGAGRGAYRAVPPGPPAPSSETGASRHAPL